MSQTPVLAPELVRESVALCRALVAAVRSWGLYPPEHPAVQAAVDRLASALPASGGTAVAFAVTPRTLAIAGVSLPDEPPVADCARLLHERDVLVFGILGVVPASALQTLLALLSRPAEEVRSTGGPAALWAERGHPSILIESIDYERLLRDRDDEGPEPRDDVWQSIVAAMSSGTELFDDAQQARLLEISGSSSDIGMLAGDVSAPKCAADGSPLITTQAATVLAVFRHLTSLVEVVTPERVPEVLRNVAAAAATLDPHVILQMLQIDDSRLSEPLVARLAAAFDDQQVAKLLAGALARDGRATARLAQVFDTIAPDVERRERVLTMTRSFLRETDFGKGGQFGAAWASMEALLLGYDEKPYVSDAYQTTLAGADARAREMAARNLPPDLPAWMDSIDQDHVRRLSVQMLTDLLSLEHDPGRAVEIARDLAALGEDVLMCGDFEDACAVATVLSQVAGTPGAVAQAACRAALTELAESPALTSAASVLGDLDEPAAQALARCCRLVGPLAVASLAPALGGEPDGPAWTRAAAIVSAFSAGAVKPLTGLADAPAWRIRWSAAVLLGRTCQVAAVAPLQALMRQGESRVTRAAIAALAGSGVFDAGRAVHDVLAAASPDSRAALLDAVVNAGDRRIVPFLCELLEGADPFGPDHTLVLDLLKALARLRDARAIPALASTLARRKRFARARVRAVKSGAIQALTAIGGDEAQQQLAATARGDRLVRKLLERPA